MEIDAPPPPELAAELPEDIPLAVVYEDDDLLVIDKPVGLVVHPGSGNWSGTLLNALLFRNPGLAGVPRAGIVHRLDKDTSGLMVVAKTLSAQTELVRQLQARTVGRHYRALVQGELSAGGTVDAPIGRHPTQRTRMAVVGGGRPALTHYRVTERFSRATLVECRLETGRTHQIRVHMAHIGHPLVGDPLYGARRCGDSRLGRVSAPGPARLPARPRASAQRRGDALGGADGGGFRRAAGRAREGSAMSWPPPGYQALAPGLLRPDWHLPPGVHALVSTREGGASLPPWASFNLGSHVGDDPRAVAANRARLCASIGAEPVWLEQVHGCAVADADCAVGVPEADAAVTRLRAGLRGDDRRLPAGAVLRRRQRRCRAHAGWRGLAAGVLERTVERMGAWRPGGCAPGSGRAIGPAAFEVGDEVRAAFVANHAGAAGRPSWRGRRRASGWPISSCSPAAASRPRACA